MTLRVPFKVAIATAASSGSAPVIASTGGVFQGSDTRQPVNQTVAPITGATIPARPGRDVVITLNSKGPLAVLTIALAGAPKDMDRLAVSAGQPIASLILQPAAGATIWNGVTAMLAGGFATWRWNATVKVWVRTA